MQKLDIRGIKAQARETLANTKPDYRKLVFLHGAVSTGVLLLVSLMIFVVSLLDDTTGGLAGMGAGALLNTSQSLISSVVSFLLPFWQAGILFTSLQVARRQRADFSMLKQGFHRLGPLLRYMILLTAILVVAGLGCGYVALIYMLIVPIPESVEAALEPSQKMETIDPYALLDSLPVAYWQYMIVPLILVFVLLMGVMAYLMYRFWGCRYVILDAEGIGARQSMSISSRFTKGHKWSLFKLEFSFWWYFLLQAILSMLVDLPSVLALAGVPLPMSAELMNLLAYLVYSAGTLALTYFAGAYVETSYACAFEELCARQREMMVVPPMAPPPEYRDPSAPPVPPMPPVPPAPPALPES